MSEFRSSTILRIECLLVLLITLFVYNQFDGNWWYMLAGFIAVDVSMVGYIFNNHVGALTYNVGHSYIIPRILLLGALVGDIRWLILLGLIWNAHISLDRALGYGLKHEAFHITHLGVIGKKR